jgi:hypothetical protein
VSVESPDAFSCRHQRKTLRTIPTLKELRKGNTLGLARPSVLTFAVTLDTIPEARRRMSNAMFSPLAPTKSDGRGCWTGRGCRNASAS